MSHDDVNGKVNGDLISREALQRVYDESCVGLCEVCKYYRVYDESTPDECVFGCKLIDDAPAVDAVEVVHGRWGEYVVVGYDGINVIWARPCSNCGYENRAFATNYCPNCGAKMDGGEKNDAGKAF